MKAVLSRLKPYLRWVILGGTLFFLLKALKDNWQEVTALRITETGWASLAIALGVTLLAHLCSGWVWGWIVREFDARLSGPQATLIYLKTNIAKYLPGNVWHFYGRVMAAKNAGVPLGTATLSVVLEPLLMATAALLVTLGGFGLSPESPVTGLPLVGLAIALLALHPRLLNPVLQRLSRLKLPNQEAAPTPASPLRLRRYPLLPLLGEMGFLLLRGAGFLLTLLAVTTPEPSQLPLLLSGFSFAWLLGLVVPGAPGGIGVFEATAIALFRSILSPGILLSAVTLYRLISVLAEALGAGLAYLDDRR